MTTWTTKKTTMRTTRTEAYAKVNLTLEVFGTRTDGYHALRSIVVPVSLSDTLEIAESDGLSCDTGYADDLCLKAARVLAESVGNPSLGAAIHVEKRTPAGGGLGGGSADAAATLVALNEMWGLGKSRRQLAELGAAVGSDVPALVLGGAVLMEGRGEIVTPFPLPHELNLVLANPGVACPTGEVYANYRPRVTDDHSIVYNMRSAIESGDWRRVAAAMMNDLQPTAIALHPEVGAALRAMKSAGVERALMSGSGSTVFGLVPNEVRGREIAALLNEKGLRAWSAHTIVP